MRAPAGDRSAIWLPLLRRLTEVSPHWVVWKNADAALIYEPGKGYLPATELRPGQGAFVYRASGGTVTLGKAPAGDASNKAAPAISTGCPKRRSGVSASRLARRSGSS